MRIILVRHAMAASPYGENLTDFIIPLTPEGVESMELVAGAVKQREKFVLGIYSSPRKRTLQTSKILSQVFGNGCAVNTIKELDLCCGDNMEWFEKICADYDNNSTCIFVGHEPGLLKLAETLICPDSVQRPIYFSRGSVLCLEFEGAPTPGAGKYVYLIHPGQLTQLERKKECV